MKKKQAGIRRIDELRDKAKTMLETRGDDIPIMSSEESRRLLHELQTYQAELEIQIEERHALEERYRLLAENVSDVVWLADLDFNCSYVSPSIEQFLGYSADEAMALSIEDAVTPASLDTLRAFSHEERQRERRGETPRKRSLTMELEFRRKDASTVWAEVTMTVLREPNGTFAHLVGVIHDIQARKEAELELRASEKRLRRILAATSDGMWDCDLVSGEIYYMPGSGDLLGYGSHELQNEAVFWGELMHPDDRAAAHAAFQAHVEGRTERYEAEFRLRDKEGEWRWILGRGEVIAWDENLRATRMVGTHTDITERKLAEERLRLLSSVVEQSTVAVAVADLEGAITFANHAFSAMYGYLPGELQGQHLSILHPPEAIAAVNAAVREIMEKGLFSGVLISRRRDGTLFPNMMWDSVLHDQSGKPIALVGVFRDITEEKRLEKALRDANAEFRGDTDDAMRGCPPCDRSRASSTGTATSCM